MWQESLTQHTCTRASGTPQLGGEHHRGSLPSACWWHHASAGGTLSRPPVDYAASPYFSGEDGEAELHHLAKVT